MIAGEACGTNPICQELASYGVNVNHHIDVLVVNQWLKNGQWGQWCASTKICMDAVNGAVHGSTKAERAAVNHWLHPAHTTESLMMELGWFDDIKAKAAAAEAALKAKAAAVEAAAKADAAKVAAFNAKVKADAEKAAAVIHAGAAKAGAVVHAGIHDVELAGEACGTNPICQELAKYGVNVNKHIDIILIKQWLKEG